MKNKDELLSRIVREKVEAEAKEEIENLKKNPDLVSDKEANYFSCTQTEEVWDYLKNHEKWESLGIDSINLFSKYILYVNSPIRENMHKEMNEKFGDKSSWESIIDKDLDIKKKWDQLKEVEKMDPLEKQRYANKMQPGDCNDLERLPW